MSRPETTACMLVYNLAETVSLASFVHFSDFSVAGVALALNDVRAPVPIEAFGFKLRDFSSEGVAQTLDRLCW